MAVNYHICIAKFFNKAMHNIANGIDFSVQDSKDAANIIALISNCDCKMNGKEALEFINVLNKKENKNDD